MQGCRVPSPLLETGQRTSDNSPKTLHILRVKEISSLGQQSIVESNIVSSQQVNCSSPQMSKLSIGLGNQYILLGEKRVKLPTKVCFNGNAFLPAVKENAKVVQFLSCVQVSQMLPRISFLQYNLPSLICQDGLLRPFALPPTLWA